MADRITPESLSISKKIVELEGRKTDLKQAEIAGNKPLSVEQGSFTVGGIRPVKAINPNLTIRDVTGARPDPIYSTINTTIKAKYIVEEIPVKSTNNIRTLASSANFLNKPKPYLDESSGDIIYTTSDDNYISTGSASAISVNGDIGTHYTMVVRDITNNKYYNWKTKGFEHGYNEICADCGGEELFLQIPHEAVETTYDVFFKPGGSTNYRDDLPTEAKPWTIKQLSQVTTTFKFINDEGYISDQTSTESHRSGVILNAGSNKTRGIPINITVLATRGIINLRKEYTISPKVLTHSMQLAGAGDDPVVVATDLTVSVNTDNNTGVISGTVTLGKSSIRDTHITFNPSQFFTI